MADSQPGRSGVRLCEVCRKHKGCSEFSVYDNVCNVCHKWFVKEVDGYYRQPERVFCTVNGGRACSIIPSCPLCRLQKFFEVTKHSKLLTLCYFCQSKTVLEGSKPKCSSCIKLLKKYHKMSDEQKQELVCSCYSGKPRKCSSCLLVTLLNDQGGVQPFHSADVDSEVEATRKENSDTEQSSSMEVETATNQDESEFFQIDLDQIPKEYQNRAKEQLRNECEVIVTKIPLEDILRAIKLPSTAVVVSDHGKLEEVEAPKKKKKRPKNSSSPLNIPSTAPSGLNNKKSGEEGGSRHYNVLNVNGTRLTLQKSTSVVSSKKTGQTISSKGQYVDGILRSAKIHQGASHDVEEKKEVVANSHSIPSSSAQNGRKVVTVKRNLTKDSSKVANKSTQTTAAWDEIVQRNSDLEKQLAEMKSRLKSNNLHEKLPSLTTPPKSENGEELLTNTGGKQKERGTKDEPLSKTSHSQGVRRDASPLYERRVHKRARLSSSSSSSSATSRSSVSESHSSNTVHLSVQNPDDALDYEDDDVSKPTRQEEGYGSNDEPKEPIKEKKKIKMRREKKLEAEKIVSKDSREDQKQQSTNGVKENDKTIARKSMAKFRIPKRTAAESVVVFPPGSVGLPPLLQQNLEQALKPSKPTIETETIKTNGPSSRMNDNGQISVLQKRSLLGSATLAREHFSRVVQTTANQLGSISTEIISNRTIMAPISHERDQFRSVVPQPQSTKENVTSSKIAPIMNELQYLPQTCRPLPSVVGIRSLHPPKVLVKNSHPQKVPVTNSLPPMVSINLKSPIVRHERKNMRFFRLNRGASSEEDSSEEDTSAVCSTRSPDTLNDVAEIASPINIEDAVSCQGNSSDEEPAQAATTKPSIAAANYDETRSVTSDSDSDDSNSSDSDSSKKTVAVSSKCDNSSQVVVASSSLAALEATETRTEFATETEEVDEDVLDLGLGDDEDFFIDQEQEEETVKENKPSSSTHQRKTPLQTENLTSVTPRTPAVQVVNPAVRDIDRSSSTLSNKVTSLSLNKSIFGSPVPQQQNSLRDDAITRGLCLELLSKGKCWYKERCPLVHDLNGQLIEFVINHMCGCGELEKARHLLIATASPPSSFCHWLITTQQGRGVIEKVIDSHLECPNTSNRTILVEKAIEVLVDINPDIPLNPKMVEKAIFAAHATVCTAKLLVRLYERFESHRLQLSMKCWDKITCVLAELRNREHTLMAVVAAQKQHPEYSASVRVMDFLLTSSLEDDIKLVQVCNLFKNYSESALRLLSRPGMMHLLDALDRFDKPVIFKHFARKFGLHALPRSEINNLPIQSAMNCLPFNSNVTSLSQTTPFQPMVVLPGMPRKVAPQLFNRVNATTRSSASDLSDGRTSPANEVSHVPIIPLSPVKPLVPISIPKPLQPLDSRMFSARPREDQKQNLVPTPLSITIPKPQELLDSHKFSAPVPREDQNQSLVPASLSIGMPKPQQPMDSQMFSAPVPREDQKQSLVPTSHEEPTVNNKTSIDISVDRPLPVDQDVEQKLRRMMEQGNFEEVTKFLLDLYDHEKNPPDRHTIVDCFLLAIKSVKVPSTDIYLADGPAEFLSVGDIVLLIISEACIEGPPEMLPLSQKEAIEDLALSTLHYLTAVNRMNSRKINQRNREIAHEFLHSLFQFRFNVAELLKHDLSLLLFCVENTIIFKNDDAFNSDDVLFMVNLLIAYHTEIIRDSSKLNRALVDEEYSLSNQIVHIAKSMMEGGENCDLNAIASVMEEYKEVSLSNKTVNDMVKSMEPYD